MITEYWQSVQTYQKLDPLRYGHIVNEWALSVTVEQFGRRAVSRSTATFEQATMFVFTLLELRMCGKTSHHFQSFTEFGPISCTKR